MLQEPSPGNTTPFSNIVSGLILLLLFISCLGMINNNLHISLSSHNMRMWGIHAFAVGLIESRKIILPWEATVNDIVESKASCNMDLHQVPEANWLHWVPPFPTLSWLRCTCSQHYWLSDRCWIDFYKYTAQISECDPLVFFTLEQEQYFKYTMEPLTTDAL